MSTFPLPKAVLDQHTVILGKTRSGKSSTMRLMVERLLDDGKPVCIIDPKGDWWGLKSSANGKEAGYEVVIFGGKHADVPINAHSGKVVGELVATGNRPCIIDLGGWMVGERTRFFIDLASTLFTRTHGHRWLCIDEAHNFAPQGKIMDPEAGKMLHWANRLASEGAGKGIVLISASQRPQKVHKDYLTSHETLIAKRVIHPLDRGAMKDWIDGCGDPTKGKAVLDSLAGLQRSEGWVWSPEIDFGPKRINFPMFSTYDSFAVQTGAADRKLKGWASVDLDEVKSKLTAVVEEAKANDPKELRAEVAKLKSEKSALERQMADAVAAKVVADPNAIKAAEARGFEQAKKKLVPAAQKALNNAIAAGLKAIAARVEEVARDLRAELPSLDAELSFQPSAPLPAQAAHRPAPSAPLQLVPRAKPVIPVADGGERPLGAERKPLAALAAVHPAGMTEAQWAVAAGLKRTGGTWSTYLSRLRMAARIVEQGDLYYVSDQGLADLGQNFTPMPPPGPALVQFWTGKIAAIGPMLNCLADAFPNWMSRQDLASAINLAVSGGTFSTYLSRLRSPGLIEEDRDGNVRAASTLMERAA